VRHTGEGINKHLLFAHGPTVCRGGVVAVLVSAQGLRSKRRPFLFAEAIGFTGSRASLGGREGEIFRARKRISALGKIFAELAWRFTANVKICLTPGRQWCAEWWHYYDNAPNE